MQIKYIEGDLFSLLPFDEPTTKVIPHVCNDIGAWGSGFVIAVSKQWSHNRTKAPVGVAAQEPSPEGSYRRWYSDGVYEDVSREGQHIDVPFVLGQLQWVRVDRRDITVSEETTRSSDTFVVNMIAQHETIRNNGKPPIRYEALVKCMSEVRDRCVHQKSIVKTWGSNPIEIHAPKFGSERAGGNWDFIAELIDELWLAHGIPVTIYEYKGP